MPWHRTQKKNFPFKLFTFLLISLILQWNVEKSYSFFLEKINGIADSNYLENSFTGHKSHFLDFMLWHKYQEF
jgi:hypothetical protein